MPSETVRSRFLKVMRGELPSDRLPMLEWASWWNLTIERWEGEGMPAGMSKEAIKAYFDLDVDYQLWFPHIAADIPRWPTKHGEGWVAGEADYDELHAYLYPERVAYDRDAWARIAERQQRGEVIVWITLEGFFWWPRVLLGIEPHLYAFYDQPEFMHRINRDQVAYIHRVLDDFLAVCTPDFMTFAEDMSYNHGPMVGRELFEEFLTPYYQQVIPRIREAGIIPIIDSDGGIEPLIPWFETAGLEGILPLERMAGVDVNRIRANHPEWKMMGGFDKTVMHLGEARIRQEFERLMPAMRAGRFLPSVDHQTPPGVSLDDYRLFLRLFAEYAAEACRGV